MRDEYDRDGPLIPWRFGPDVAGWTRNQLAMAKFYFRPNEHDPTTRWSKLQDTRPNLTLEEIYELQDKVQWNFSPCPLYQHCQEPENLLSNEPYSEDAWRDTMLCFVKNYPTYKSWPDVRLFQPK